MWPPSAWASFLLGSFSILAHLPCLKKWGLEHERAQSKNGWKGNLWHARKYLQIRYLSKGLIFRLYKEHLQFNNKLIPFKNVQRT